MHRHALTVTAALFAAASAGAAQTGNAATGLTEPAALYAAACANCHGLDGAGASPSRLAFEEEVPDFSECTFATREPDADWGAIAMGGGPVRGFSRMMPSFEGALTEEQIEAILSHIRTFCADAAWPRGELNLPRALVTEKAYPEDEAVLSSEVALEGGGAVLNELIYEKRFGARSQIEVKVPFGVRERADASGWVGGLGDLAFAFKHAFAHGLRTGSILSGVAEVKVPTGKEEDGFGAGQTVFEPYLAYGQILPADAFVQAQAGVELPVGSGDAESEGFWRIAGGRTFTSGAWGRAWTPMLELLGATELEGGGTSWDLVPQMQVTLNTRQHVMVNAGVRLPLNGGETRVLLYLLWDWFDGGFFDGW